MLPKVVFDTNIFISAIIFGGNPRICLEIAKEGRIELFTSKELLLELSEKLHKKFQWNDEDIKDVIVGISRFAKIIKPLEKVNKIKIDPTDNRVLEVAKWIKADLIISGDKRHILPLKRFGKARILTAAEFIIEVKLQN
ncbi:putative toxin-antitoxin system toxin component, PIN family [Candidatus Gottesmanbacteria bacterium]|nr:putative toxin-antitoxin system toxin component, PIN family [Candidatus Gottesmanbacteria bacterium]